MDQSRRSFLKMIFSGGMIAAGVSLIPKVFTADSKEDQATNEPIDMTYPNPNDPNRAFGMIIDLDKCNGCVDLNLPEPPCSEACRYMHNVPPRMDWIKIFYRQGNPLQKGYYFPRLCMQCENPPCTNVCPVGAAFRRNDGDGLVLIDNNICIGCRLCMAACPYEVRYFNWDEY